MDGVSEGGRVGTEWSVPGNAQFEPNLKSVPSAVQCFPPKRPTVLYNKNWPIKRDGLISEPEYYTGPVDRMSHWK